MKKFVILVSGNGSNLQTVIDAVNAKVLNIKICLVVCNMPNAYALDRAKKAGIPSLVFSKNKNMSREEYDSILAEKIKKYNPDYIFLLGWMRILTKNFLSQFPVINLHPALPGTFSGTNAIARQFEAFKFGKITECGVMTHYVPDESVDLGPVILTHKVDIYNTDTLSDFESRVHRIEHKLVLETIQILCK